MRARAVLAIAAIVVLLGLAWLSWAALYRQRSQPASITSDRDANFLYGSIGNESDQGLPYWVAVVLPRVFGERYLPGPGGYAALLQWDEGQELPVGFAKKRVGVDRVGFNCALCHTPDHGMRKSDIKGLAEFFSKSASDARFNADTILTEIDLAYRLSVVDRLVYRYVLIPASRERLLALGRQLTSPHAAGGWPRSTPSTPFPAGR
jgi:hypothetical protein